MKLNELGREERFKLCYPIFMILSRDPQFFQDNSSWKYMDNWEDGDLDTLYEVFKEIYEISKIKKLKNKNIKKNLLRNRPRTVGYQ